MGGFLLATRLEPDPAGSGTHRQLGLPPCRVKEVFHVPCPSCGMTTSFSHFVRGQIFQSARANAAGLLLAIFCAVQIPWALRMAVTGQYRAVYSVSDLALAMLAVITAVAVIQWVIRLCL